MDNQRQSQAKEFYIPMEVTKETIKDFNIDCREVVWWKICNRKCQVIMVKATEEQYKAYMRPIWKESKYVERHVNNELPTDAVIESNDEKADKHQQVVLSDKQDVAEDLVYKEAIYRLQGALDRLEELDREIILGFYIGKNQTEIGEQVGLKQRTVSNRLQRIFAKLRADCKDEKILLARC